MKILVLTGSPRRNGNSNTLATHFIRGAEEAGHTVVRYDAGLDEVSPCMACNACGMNGDCVIDDGFDTVRENIVDADCVVFATPMYYFGMSAQLKAVIDRFYSINGRIHVRKKSCLIVTYADSNPKEEEPIRRHYDLLLEYLGWTNAGVLVAPGMWPEGAVNGTDYPAKAYEMGKSL